MSVYVPVARTKEIRARHAGGMDAKEIAAEFHLAKSTVYRVLRISAPPTLSDDTIEQIKELRATGLSWNNISKQLGLPYSTTYTAGREEGARIDQDVERAKKAEIARDRALNERGPTDAENRAFNERCRRASVMERSIYGCSAGYTAERA